MTNSTTNAMKDHKLRIRKGSKHRLERDTKQEIEQFHEEEDVRNLRSDFDFMPHITREP